MKKLSNLSKIGYLVGIIFSLFSAIRYFLLFPDTDRAMVYVLIGIIICAIAFLYDKNRSLSFEVDAMSEYIVDKKFEKSQEIEDADFDNADKSNEDEEVIENANI